MEHRKNHKPPFFGRWLLGKICPQRFYEDVEGDLHELYQNRLRKGNPKWIADIRFLAEVLASYRLKSIQPNSEQTQHYDKDHLAMLKNYIKIAFRNIAKHKAYHALNIGGLAIGVASFLMILLFVRFELSYDTWMLDSDQLYRVPMEIIGEGNSRKFSMISATAAPTLEQDYPQVEESLRLWRRTNRLVELSDDLRFYENNIYYADPSFFQFFSLNVIDGNRANLLDRPNTVVLSESAAIRYFGEESALGETLIINGSDYEVTGVMEDTPQNTHHEFNMLLSWSSLGDWGALESWHLTMFYTYVKLVDGTDIEAFGEEIKSLANRYVEADLQRQRQQYVYFLEPVSDIHLKSDFGFEAKPGGSITTVYIFSVIAGLILFIACLNFINLSTARSEIRAREVGMRKVIGAQRFSLIGQFLGEAIVLSFLSFILAIFLFALVLPWYNQFTGLPYALSILITPQFVSGMLLLAIFVGLLAGFYPALVLSSFSPLSMFNRGGSSNVRGALLRKVLVVSQFTISVILIVSTITVFRQINFMMEKELGFHKEQMMILPIRGGFDLEEQQDLIKNGFSGLSTVQHMSLSSSIPGRGASNFAIRIDREENDMTQSMFHMFVDFDFAETYGLELLAGRDFSDEYSQDFGDTFLINEEAVKSFGWTSPEEAIGQRIQSGAGGFVGEVVGVFRNFHYQSVDQVVDPLVLNTRDGGISMVTLRLASSDVSLAIDQARAEWATLFPTKPFDYFFLDEAFNDQYADFEKTGRIILIFSVLAIFIACMGLYGLAAFSAEQRTREIGIRKVFGASIPSLVKTISSDFLKLVGVSILIGLPGSLWLISLWLDQFAYRIQPGVVMFLASGIIAVCIAMFTISYQSIRAALANPVDSIRN